MNVRKPPIDFIGIGAEKSATTWIYQCLKEHPEICMAEPKETAFFVSPNFEKGFSWYAEKFAHCADGKKRGEYSNAYLDKPGSPTFIKESYPNAKLLVCFRNPIERFLSSVYFQYSLGNYDKPDFSDGFESRYAKDFRRGRYYESFKRYTDIFDKDQILIMFHDDIQKDPEAFMQRIYTFIGVDDSFVAPSTHGRANVTAENRERSRLVRHIYYTLRKILIDDKWYGKYVLALLRYTGLLTIACFIISLNRRSPSKYKPLEKKASQETRDKIRAHYEEDIRGLERMVGKSLDFWK